MSSGAASAVRRAISAVIRRSVSIGRWGPWSSSVATGIRQTRSSAAARRTSGHVRRPYSRGLDHIGQVDLLERRLARIALRHPEPSLLELADHREEHGRVLAV